MVCIDCTDLYDIISPHKRRGEISMTQVQVECGYPGTGGSGSICVKQAVPFSKVAPSNEGTG